MTDQRYVNCKLRAPASSLWTSAAAAIGRAAATLVACSFKREIGLWPKAKACRVKMVSQTLRPDTAEKRRRAAANRRRSAWCPVDPEHGRDRRRNWAGE